VYNTHQTNITESHRQKNRKQNMADTKIKPQHHPPKSFLKSPLSLYFLAPSCLSGYKSIMQNKANFKMGNINISTAKTKAYATEQRTMNTKRYPKQTQSNPICLPATRFSGQKRTSRDRFLRRSCARGYRRILHRRRSHLCTAGTAWSLPALPPHSPTHPSRHLV